MNKKNMFYTRFFELTLLLTQEEKSGVSDVTNEILQNSISYLYINYWY